jgi:hypothetical protein
MNVPYCLQELKQLLLRSYILQDMKLLNHVFHDVTNVVPVNQPPTAKYAGNNNKPDQPTKTIYLSLTNHLQDQKCHVLGFAQ